VANPAGLTSRETEVLGLLAARLSNAQIAERLGLSGRTVDNHVSAILRKLGVRTRREAGAQAERLGPQAGVSVPQPGALSSQPRVCYAGKVRTTHGHPMSAVSALG
jgi:DNA-binding CsgD family transcriptional regulator